MTAHTASKIVRHEAPGEVRAAVLDPDGRPFRLFALRWRGVGEPARYGGTYTARLRKFADELCGAFLELDSGEEAFLRLKSRRDVTEGMALNVRVESEARQGKLARVMRVAEVSKHSDPFEHWCSQVSPGARCEIYADRDAVNAAFEEAFSKSVTLFGGGHLHIDRTRALTAFDLDTAGRAEKGSAGARALSINRDAAAEMARQVSLRNLGGNLVLDCVGPLNKKSGDLNPRGGACGVSQLWGSRCECAAAITARIARSLGAMAICAGGGPSGRSPCRNGAARPISRRSTRGPGESHQPFTGSNFQNRNGRLICRSVAKQMRRCRPISAAGSRSPQAKRMKAGYKNDEPEEVSGL